MYDFHQATYITMIIFAAGELPSKSLEIATNSLHSKVLCTSVIPLLSPPKYHVDHKHRESTSLMSKFRAVVRKLPEKANRSFGRSCICSGHSASYL